MPHRSRRRGLAGRFAIVGAVVAFSLAMASTAFAAVHVRVVSQDPYTNASSYHATQVEADTYAYGDTIVSDFQSGRFFDGGASNIGWVTSANGGRDFRAGFLPSTTVFADPPGPYKRVTDPAATYDAMHDTWLLVVLASRSNSGFVGNDVFVSRSTDGGVAFGAPVIVKSATGSQDFDSTWINCDNWASSPNYGHCYVEWDDFGSGNILHLSTSTDAGLTWTDARVPRSTIVLGGSPLSQPNGTVVVPIDDGFVSSAQSFVSTDGGASYSGPFAIATLKRHHIAGSLRSLDTVSADVDAEGTVYVTWYDCRFRAGCSSNDIVMSSSTDGMTWTAPVRVPIDPTTSTVDHFLAGVTVDPTTSGASAHLGLIYYFYPKANCTESTCKLMEGFVGSNDGGATWSTAVRVAGPFHNTWLPFTTQGYMAGDYQSASFIRGRVTSVFAVAKKGTCQLGEVTSCNVPMAAPAGFLTTAGPFHQAGLDRPVAGVRSDQPVGGLKSTH